MAVTHVGSDTLTGIRTPLCWMTYRPAVPRGGQVPVGAAGADVVQQRGQHPEARVTPARYGCRLLPS
jgi:hypothetical protein